MASSSSPPSPLSSPAVDPDHLPPAISARALADLLLQSPGNNRVRVLDGSWFMPNVGRDGRAEFLAGPRIAGSRFFDVAGVCDRETSLPHMLPSALSFAAAAGALGIEGLETPVVVYDRAGVFSAPRVWWTFKVFGHKKSVEEEVFLHFVFFFPFFLFFFFLFFFLFLYGTQKQGNISKRNS